jgi:ribosomal protein S18 acetylase RimI-like enzyme
MALGTQVMAEILNNLRDQGVTRLELLVVSDNRKAIEFYKKLGFEVEGVLKHFLKRAASDDYVDELAMALILR